MDNFVNMSRYAGMREDLVQAGGGNSAYKITPEKMAIKASGYQLADVTAEEGYALVNPEIIKKAFMECPNLDDMTEQDSKKILEEAFIEGARPSIETFLHSVVGRYSLHTHPIVVNALTCRKNGADTIKELFPEALIVPYATPGVQLAKAYFKAYKQYKAEVDREPEFIFLMNHGFITSAETADEVILLTENVTKRIEEYLGVDYSDYHEMSKLQVLYEDGIIWKVTDLNVLEVWQKLGKIWKHYFCPDCIVFLGKELYMTKEPELNRQTFDSFVERNGYPTVLAIGDSMYIHADSVKKALEIQSVLSFSAQVMLLNKKEECEFLSEEEKNYLLNWDAEKYRRKIR